MKGTDIDFIYLLDIIQEGEFSADQVLSPLRCFKNLFNIN
ncbi:hypothetical protein L950_0206980 [Sphingobacterium sp. IITKGP-BTPF85]|nr:hypothetical protein L950_0206980 [Sphingobacterium sp. IITKGP-BTPF85]